MTSRRKDIPRATRLEVLMEAGYMCGNPACRHILTLELHHMTWVADGGGNDASNLLALCPNCHSLHTHGQIPPEAIRHWKGMLLALNNAFDRESMDLLLFIEDIGTIVVSGDGVVRFARLAAAGLAIVARHKTTKHDLFEKRYEVTTLQFDVYISAKGKRLLADSVCSRCSGR